MRTLIIFNPNCVSQNKWANIAAQILNIPEVRFLGIKNHLINKIEYSRLYEMNGQEDLAQMEQMRSGNSILLALEIANNKQDVLDPVLNKLRDNLVIIRGQHSSGMDYTNMFFADYELI